MGQVECVFRTIFYWPHLPAVWLIVWCGLWLLTRLRRLSSFRLPLVLFMANIGLHLVLDTIVGGESALGLALLVAQVSIVPCFYRLGTGTLT